MSKEELNLRQAELDLMKAARTEFVRVAQQKADDKNEKLQANMDEQDKIIADANAKKTRFTTNAMHETTLTDKQTSTTLADFDLKIRIAADARDAMQAKLAADAAEASS